jgi:hypothetical protein
MAQAFWKDSAASWNFAIPTSRHLDLTLPLGEQPLVLVKIYGWLLRFYGGLFQVHGGLF